MKDILDFLTELRQHNNRDWFNERKDRFYELRATFLNRGAYSSHFGIR